MIKFYNSLKKKLEKFSPIEEKRVKIYSCGPTVYDYAHIGNFRSYIFSDLLRRFLKYKGYKISHVMNITDVDDKTIHKAQREGKSLQQFTKEYTEAFFHDLRTLNIEEVEFYPRATEHIDDMVRLIKKLERKELTYISEGSVYFNISRFRKYGNLSGVDLGGMKKGSRVDHDEYKKDDIKDFVLWKAKKQGEPFWNTVYGEGRPGWHIECSAMSMKYLGPTLDIHTGGVDLIFPHHENEIAQSEGATGKPFVRYWLHCAHLIVEGEKMSKSKNNFFTLRDLLKKGYTPRAIRYLLLSVHYRKQLNFTEKSAKAATAAVLKIQNFYDTVKELRPDNKKNHGVQNKLRPFLINFDRELENDLNISPALASLFDFIHMTNRFIIEQKITEKDKGFILKTLKRIDNILGILQEKESVPEEVLALVNEREEARKSKDFKKADRIRDEVIKKGFVIEDTKEGARVKKIE
ncbi:MAG: cysteine--tRNA ligase [Spirochaetes bacterium]|nr:cysteine--tRNA ligase [Spirochaetota bacterium]